MWRLWGFVFVLAVTSVSAEPQALTLTPLAQAMGRGGVAHCQERVHQVSDFLAGGVASSASIILPPDHVNDRMVSASMEVFDGSVLFYANADFAPLVAYGCDASFETVSYWPNKCEVVAKTQFAQAKNNGKLRQAITLLSAGSNLQIFLMPAGSGCVAIKKQIIFDRF